MPKQQKTTKNIKKQTNPSRKQKEHPLAKYSRVRKVPLPVHPSPITQTQWRSPDNKNQVERMERKLRGSLEDLNSPCAGEAVERRAIGECSEDAFDMYLSASMDPTLYDRKEYNSPHITKWGTKTSIKNISYEFNYPNFPSFGDISWANNYVVVEQEDVVSALKKKGAIIENEFAMANKLFRCIAKKLVITFDTQTEVYYVRMNHWVQSLSEDLLTWIDSY